MAERKSIFITGAASGIGRAVALSFAGKGWFVGLADVNEAGLAETIAMIPEGQSSCHRLDVRSRGEWDQALLAFWKASGGRMDVLFNNAGVGKGGPLAQSPVEDDDLVVDVNIRGVLNGAKAGHAYLKQTPGSCLLNTSSTAGIVGTAGLSVYSASKFAVRGLTEALDQEWEEDGIKVRSLMPAFIDTPILDGISAGSNRKIRESVRDAGLEISPVSLVVDAAWAAIAGKAVHTRVGKTAHRAWFLQRWAPGLFRRQAKLLGKARKSV
jgi:NAD(P)-dependent dehydrogenase (short-subunit alcohol dehydrogenase family)